VTLEDTRQLAVFKEMETGSWDQLAVSGWREGPKIGLSDYNLMGRTIARSDH